VLTSKQVSKNYIHAACVSSLTTGKIMQLQHLNFCDFTLWLPGAVAPFATPLHATDWDCQ